MLNIEVTTLFTVLRLYQMHSTRVRIKYERLPFKEENFGMHTNSQDATADETSHLFL